MEYNVNLHLIRVILKFQKALHRQVFSHVRKYGLTENQFVVLEMLYSKGTLTVNEIIEKAHSTDGNMSVVIQNLEKFEFITKSVDEHDKRIRRVSLTPKGKHVIEIYFPLHVQHLDELFDSVSAQDKQTLIALLKKVGKNFENESMKI